MLARVNLARAESTIEPQARSEAGLSDSSLAELNLAEPSREPDPRAARARLPVRSILLGLVAALVAVAIRYITGLSPEVLPFFFVVMAVCLVTVSAGVVGGVTTMIVGGLLSWYFILGRPGSWALDTHDVYSLIGYFSVTLVILLTSQLYRKSEQERHATVVELAQQEAQHQRLFAREMSHRLKNAMAIIQAMASQTFPRDSAETSKFDGRLRALADAHNLLNEHVKQPTASVTELVETAIEPFRDRANRFRISGPPLPLPDQQVVSLALALHELGTNAVKYGALGEPNGWVSIDWEEGPGGRLALEWKEHDGPAVAAPSSTGFGSRLLQRSAMGAELHFEPDGLRCLIRQRF
jgi:two-component sensor histidine kinase